MLLLFNLKKKEVIILRCNNICVRFASSDIQNDKKESRLIMHILLHECETKRSNCFCSVYLMT